MKPIFKRQFFKTPVLFFILALATTFGVSCARLEQIGCSKNNTSRSDVSAPLDIQITDLSQRAHSHNDYAQAKPLVKALAAHFGSIEADVWLRAGEVVVGHSANQIIGSLEKLYLTPLNARIDENHGSVYGDGVPLVLWLDLKDGSPLFQAALLKLLDRQPNLTRYRPSGIEQRPIYVILTGDPAGKTGLANMANEDRPFSIDSNEFSEGTQPVSGPMDPFRAYALDWYRVTEWTGEGNPTTDDIECLQCLAESARREGRVLRFWNSPDFQNVWQEDLDSGVFYLNTDRLDDMSQFLKEKNTASLPQNQN